MLEEIPKLSHVDPKVSKNAALAIIQHVSQNKNELNYLVKRLVTGLESVKVSTRAGSYTTLSTLLRLKKVDPFDLFDLMQKCLITNKESTKKERRLIYIARILCTGAIFRSVQASELAKDPGFLQSALKDLIDLSGKKSTYFLLTTPFLSHLLQDKSLTQEIFDTLLWPSISSLFQSSKDNQSKAGKKKRKKKDDETSDEEDEEEEEGEAKLEDANSINFCCQVQLALDCKNGEYRDQDQFECLKEPGKIAKALLTSSLQFKDTFLQSLFKHFSAGPSDHIQLFWENLTDNIKSTQFDLLCLAVSLSAKENLPISAILSKKLLRLLLSVFKSEDKEFHRKSAGALDLLLKKWSQSKKGKDTEDKDKSAVLPSKKERKKMLKILFDAEEPPNLLHEYKFVHKVVRNFLNHLNAKDLERVQEIMLSNLFEDKGVIKLGPRMALVYLQTLGRIAQAKETSPEVKFDISLRLLNISLGKEEVPIKKKEEEEDEKKNTKRTDEADLDSGLQGIQEQIKKCCLTTLHQILCETYSPEFISLMSTYLIENATEISSNEVTLKLLKDIKKALKKYTENHPHLEYILRAYGIRVVLDEGQAVTPAIDSVQALLELAKNSKQQAEEDVAELLTFITGTVVRESNPPFQYESLFNKLLMEGKVKEEVMQVFADAIDVEVGPEGDDEDADSDEEEETPMEIDQDESDSDNDSDGEVDEEDQDAAVPPKKKSKLDPAKLAKLKEAFGANSDSDESDQPLDDAPEEDLQRMDNALAKVFAVKKSVKDEGKAEERALMRTLRLVDAYIRRHLKEMPVSSLLMLLMPVVHCIQNSLKLKKSPLPTKIIAILDNLNRVKRFTDTENVVEGTLATMAMDLFEMGQQKKNKLIKELLDHSMILLTKCFLQKPGKRSKKDQKKFIGLYCKAVDVATSKIKQRRKIPAKKRNGKGGGNVNMNMNTSRFVRLALETFPEWEEGKKAIQDRIQNSSDDNKNNDD